MAFRKLVLCWKIIKQYLANCSIHGVRYLVDAELSHLEKLFWLISCAFSWWGCASMVQDVIHGYTHHSVAVTAETMYLDWQTPFPSIAFCVSSTSAIRNKYFKQNPGTFTNYSFETAVGSTATELLDAYAEIKVPCSEFLHTCTWNNIKFNCCTEFWELEKTGIGHCIAINSLHSARNGNSGLKYIVNRSITHADLIVDITVDKSTKTYFPKAFEIYVLNNVDIPMITTSEDNSRIRAKSGKTTRVEFTMQDVHNEEAVRNIPIIRRKCRFPNEILEDSLFGIYSASTCELEAIIRRMIKFCGCVNFYYNIPPNARACNITEMQCLLNYKPDIVITKTKECILDCEGRTLTINRLDPSENDAPGDGLSRIHFTLLAHPTVRYRRYVVTDVLSCVVGGATGLFLGASILSIFEIPYWLFIRRDRLS